MVNFSNVKEITIPNGNVKKITRNGVVLWKKNTGRLPSEYQEVEYLESDGNQYIITDYYNKTYTEYRYKTQMLGFYGRWNTIFGARGDYNSTDAFDVGFENNNTIYINIGGHNPVVNSNLVLNQDYEFIVNKDSITINNNTTALSNSLINGIYKIYLFAGNQQNSLLEPASIRMYYFEVYENNEMIMNFIPCYRKSDEEIGLYELVEGKFYTNDGTGVFQPGPEVGPQPSSDIPDIYQKVEYIESNGEEYINTNYLHKTNTKYAMTITPTGYNTEYNSVFGGRYLYNSNDAYGLGFRNGGWFYCNVGGNNVFSMYLVNLNTKYKIIMDKQTTSFNGNSTNTMGSNLTNGIYYAYIFALNEQGQTIEYSKMKLYSFKIYEGVKIIKDYVPCYRKADNVIGLYEKINGEFLTNAGTGAFTKGSDIG